ncbi:hypothetical protein U6A24_20410 [Aquimarina gracilis]|uniref:Natural product n=1 Tax=Aquimarina gracilis TaxID=874422 RepID=A0ABU6A161_9FLAO|nr:hypothetical protein [Aquimarina gracilis]MEB3347852.1 hypothetical protein [Aquimarina gracilis]
MKNVKGKKLSLKKLSIATLDNMSLVKGGFVTDPKSRGPGCTGIFIKLTHNQCPTYLIG